MNVDTNMSVVASVAHRGAPGFLPSLLENVAQFVKPNHTCVFTWANLTNTSFRTVFVEPQGSIQKQPALILLRPLRCAMYIANLWPHYNASRVTIVLVAANMRFHRPCNFVPSTFALEPMGSHDWWYDDVRRRFKAPPRYGGARWNRSIRFVLRSRKRFMPHFAQVLRSTNVTPWKPPPVVKMPHEGSYYPLSDLMAASGPIQRLLASVPWVAQYPEEALLPTWIAQQRAAAVPTMARPLMCIRVFTKNRSVTYEDVLPAISSVQDVCALKMVGREHLFS